MSAGEGQWGGVDKLRMIDQVRLRSQGYKGPSKSTIQDRGSRHCNIKGVPDVSVAVWLQTEQ